MTGWIAVDLDGVLAEYHGWPKDGSIGAPVPKMVERVKAWLAEGNEVRIFTARVWPLGVSVLESEFPGNHDLQNRLHQAAEQKRRIEAWCLTHLGRILPVTCVKDYAMTDLFDDRCHRIAVNTGEIVGE